MKKWIHRGKIQFFASRIALRKKYLWGRKFFKKIQWKKEKLLRSL